MALLYDWYEQPGSHDKPEEEKLLYPRVCLRHKVKTDALCERIEQMSTASRADILLVLSALSDIMSSELREGSQVQLEGIGYFSLSLSATEPVYRDTKNKYLKLRIGGINFQPDKRLKEAVKFARVERIKDILHSRKLTDEEIDGLLTTYFAEHPFINRVNFQSLCGLTQTTACHTLRRLLDGGKLLNEGTRSNPIYVPTPGYFGKAEAASEAEQSEETEGRTATTL